MWLLPNAPTWAAALSNSCSGDAPQGGRYQQQPAYQTQPDYGYGGRRTLLPPMDPQQSMRQEEVLDPAQRPLDPKYEKQVVEYHGKERSVRPS